MRADVKANEKAKRQAQEEFEKRALGESRKLISLVNVVFVAEKECSVPKLHKLANSLTDPDLEKRLQEVVRFWILAGVSSARFFELYETFDELAKKAEEKLRPGIGCGGTYLIPDDLLQILRKELRKTSEAFLELAATA